MNFAQIKVGEQYAVGSTKYARQAVVLEVGELPVTVRGRRWGQLRTIPKAVKVQFLPAGQESNVLPRAVIRTWEEELERREAQRRYEAERVEQARVARNVADELRAAFERLGMRTYPHESGAGIQFGLSTEQSRKLLSILEEAK